MQYLAVLGRQPKISLAELESLFCEVCQISDQLATFSTPKNLPNHYFSRLGGSPKIAIKLSEPPLEFLKKNPAHKLNIAVSDYSKKATAKSTLKFALTLKRQLKTANKAIRIINTTEKIQNTATSHHNQIGEKPNSIEIIRYNDLFFSVVHVQNISAYAERDQKRPARDAKNGMLPPKLAQILLNLAGNLPQNSLILDPFCGSGVVLQEAILMHYRVSGSDLNAIMAKKTLKNLHWLQAVYLKKRPITPALTPDTISLITSGDATSHQWQYPPDAVVAEVFLGTPMSTPPPSLKLTAEKQNCTSIILGFLKNLHLQIKSGTPVILAIPAWLRSDGTYSRLNLLDAIHEMGYNVKKYHNSSQSDLLYHRDGQVVAREIISLRKQ